MGDWPSLVQEHNRIVISTGSPECMGTELCVRGVGPTVGAWPSASYAIYIPFVVPRPFTADVMAVQIGTAAGTNHADVGLFDTGGNKLVTMGSTVVPNTAGMFTFDITDTTLNQGVYYMGMSADNGTDTFLRSASMTVQGLGASGMLSQAVAFPLPSPATFASVNGNFNYVPMIMVSGRTVV